MKLTIQQEQFLSKYLRENLLYRETYTEFYDHIISALAVQPADLSFQLAVEKIIKEDFGGYDGMRAIEQTYKNTVSREVKTKYLAQFVNYFKLPSIGFTIAITAALYWVTKQTWFNFLIFMGIICAMRLIPDGLKWLRNYKLGYSFSTNQKSVRDSVFEWLSFLPVIIFGAIAIANGITGISPGVWFNTINPAVLTGLLLLCTLHMLAFYKIYSNGFKLNIT